MKATPIHEIGGQRAFAVVFDKGDEMMSGLEQVARDEQLSGAQVTAIGAFSSAVLGYFDPERREYRRIPVDEQVELLSLVGDVARRDGEAVVHAHVVVGRPDGSTRGGHLLQARVWPTAEVMIMEAPAHLRRRSDPETGLALIDLGTSGSRPGGA